MDERFVELAEKAVDAERANGVSRVSAALAANGSGMCDDCGEEIEAARRAAAPFARRCVPCQRLAERGCV
ncbi:TraR/DksA C4-type zinc finger protein [Ruegeria sp. 2012CJ41-6]|uniref:TraR/DksA C4-type zinc finger protein n=1 Tax=Ruegeria spongiae TaxID=2942209 RepID=A0ABT0Q8S7_9RHOB|nr:TraR/DksA C4-type zinc finger protein [Ruegeria spongiae]MCL6285583.1 TraR/DksA C4-type zinc finger protein [Ruegeria spongiae]